MAGKNNISDFEALKKWSSIPEDLQQRLIDNVFCLNCGVTTIVDYSITADKFGILLKGKCKICGNEVARLIEDE